MTSTGMRPFVPVSAPPRVRDLIRGAPDGPVPVVHVGRHAIYVAIGRHCAGLLGREAALVPCGLRSRIDNFGAWLGRSAYLSNQTLHVDGVPLVVGRAVDVSVPPLDHEAIPRRHAASPTAASATPQAAAAGLVRRVTARAVGGLVGVGGGLTPLGDDLLCGWIATHRAAGSPTPAVDTAIRAHLHRTTVLSGTLLECAMHGEALPELGRFLGAVGTAGEPVATADLLAVGGTSGAGLLHGARLALAELAGCWSREGAA